MKNIGPLCEFLVATFPSGVDLETLQDRFGISQRQLDRVRQSLEKWLRVKVIKNSRGFLLREKPDVGRHLALIVGGLQEGQFPLLHVGSALKSEKGVLVRSEKYPDGVLIRPQKLCGGGCFKGVPVVAEGSPCDKKGEEAFLIKDVILQEAP